MTDHPRQLERVDCHPSAEHPPDLAAWPFAIPAVVQLIEEGGLEIPPGITFLVGENGSGKSTLVEALAAVYPRPDRQRPQQARAWGGEQLSAQSHGESFLAVLRHRFGEVGVPFMDEPEAALSFRSRLALIALLDEMRAEGSQVVVATHSPLPVALPGATLLELGEWASGARPTMSSTWCGRGGCSWTARGRLSPPPAGGVAG